MTFTDARTVGFAGLGVMGSAMSGHLLRAGTPVLGFDPDPVRMNEHVARGGLAADRLAELGGLDVVVTSLPSAEALAAVLDDQDGIVAGFTQRARPDRRRPIVIETSTLALETKTDAARRLAAVGAVLLDCPMSGTGQQARDGDLVAYLSGDDQPAKGEAVEVLRRVTRAQYDFGAFGNGTKAKVVANLLVTIHNVAAAEALLLARRAGLDLDEVLVAVGDGAGGSRMLQVRGPLMVSGNFDDATMRIKTFAKDIDIIADFARMVGSPTPIFDASALIYDEAARHGRGEQDTASVFGVLEGRDRSDHADGREDHAAP